MSDLYLGFDLGGDSLKVAYAFKNSSGELMVGKIFAEEDSFQPGLSAKVLYDKQGKKWYYGDEIETSGVEDFTNTVKIKDLLGLLKNVTSKKLAKAEREEIQKSNKDFYENKKYFPKFRFPHKVNHINDFQKLVDLQDVFEAEETPQAICENYFKYVKRKVNYFVDQIAGKVSFKKNAQISLVYPTNAGAKYCEEFRRIIEKVFGKQNVVKTIKSTRAISYWALKSKYFKENDHFLIFDLGEETISVVKGNIDGKDIMLDGADGHSLPIDLGGIDVDNAVFELISKQIIDRETLGYPSAGNEGHLYEQPLRSKQYLFMKNIKHAKVLFGMDDYEKIFENKNSKTIDKGIPISIVREVLVQRYLRRKEFKDCLGLNKTNQKSVAQQILKYIEEEVKKNINEKVNKILIAGGVSETVGLVDFIKTKLKREIITFDNVPIKSIQEQFKINTTEESVYAAAVGGALVALDKYEISILFSRYYGTYGTKREHMNLKAYENLKDYYVINVREEKKDNGEIEKKLEYRFPHFVQFKGATKGKKIEPPKGQKYCQFWTDTVFNARDSASEDEFFACPSQLKTTRIGNYELPLIGFKSSKVRKELEEKYGLIDLFEDDTDEPTKIYYYYKDKRIGFKEGKEENKGQFYEGLFVDIDGNAIPVLHNAVNKELHINGEKFDAPKNPQSNPNKKVLIHYIDKPLENFSVSEGEIEYRFNKEITFITNV